MFNRFVKFLPGVLAMCGTLLAPGLWTSSGSALAAGHDEKIDSHLRKAIEREGEVSSHRVIVRIDPKANGAVRALLQARGDRLVRFHPGIGAFTVDSKRLRALSKHPAIRSISFDAPLN